MPALNKVILIGYLSKDVVTRSTTNGTSFCEISLLLSRTFKGQDGQERKENVFVDVMVSGRLASLCPQYLHKGSRVYVEGRLFLQSWVDKKSGDKRQRLRVAGERVLFLSPKDNQMHDVDEPAEGAGGVQGLMDMLKQ